MESKKKSRDFSPKHFALIFFGLLIVLLTFMGIMSWQNYLMIDMGTEYLLFGLLIVGAMIFGLAMLLRKMMNKIARVITGALCGVIIVAVAVGMLALFTFIVNVSVPAQYAVLTSPGGEKVVVMREWDLDADLMNARMQARCEKDTEAVPGELTEADMGYAYFAAPRVLGMFYDADAKSEGRVNIGVMSNARLMHIWEGETLRMYAENPEPGDSGEIILNME